MSTTADHPTPGATRDWTPSSWKSFPIVQAPPYPDPAEVDRYAAKVSALPPLVTSWEVERLRSRVADAAAGHRFLLQGGDCAELFESCDSRVIANKLKILLQMSLVILDGLKKPVVRIGRFAGQYAKPRSRPFETIDGVEMPSYFGDLINGAAPTAEARTPDPARLLSAYHHAAMTLNFIRGLIDGGFADIHHPEYWDLNFLGKAGLTAEMRSQYLRRTERIGRAIEMVEVMTDREFGKLQQVEFYTSHEGLSLHYEAAVTRTVPRRTGYYNLGCHLPWIGERTRQLDHAHVEYFRGIRNPIGVKLGPKVTQEDLRALLERLDPSREDGRIVLITRFGRGRVRESLPPLLEAARSSGRRPAWVCDPMHGNTTTTKSGVKTRHVDAILEELHETIDVHGQVGTNLAGVHFELTAENVTECVGGASGVSEDDLQTAYESLCDPRLNYEQAMEVAFAIAQWLEGRG